MSHRIGKTIVRSKGEALPIETWADKEGLLAEQKP